MSALFLAPLVVARRLPQLWFEALHPNPMVSDETRLAVTEKVEALVEGAMAGQMAAALAPMNFALAMMQGRSPMFAALSVPKTVARAATAPMELRVKHNLRRLSGPLRQRSRSTSG